MGSSHENCFVFPLSLKMAAPISALPYGLCERMRATLTRFPLSKWQHGRSKDLVWRLQEQETINWVGRERDGAVLGMPAQKQGFPINPSMYGPLTDLPDWSFADGRPAPPMKRQLERKEKNKEFARRVVQLSAEIDHGMEKWKAKQKQREEMEKEKQAKRLQPKGNICFQASK